MKNPTISETKYFGIQRKVISHMTYTSWRSKPHVSYIYEPDITDFYDAYLKLKERSGNYKLTFNTLMLRVIVEGLKAAPHLNSHFSYHPWRITGKLKIASDININLPWILPTGEMMGINLRGFQDKSLSEMTSYICDVKRRICNSDLHEAIMEISVSDTFDTLKRADVYGFAGRIIGCMGKSRTLPYFGFKKWKYYKNRKKEDRLTKHDFDHGTVTISNFGSLYKDLKGFAGLMDLTPKQVFAVSIGSAQKKAGVIINGSGEETIAIRTMIPLCLVFDHCALDFGELIPFIKKLDEIFLNPEVILEW